MTKDNKSNRSRAVSFHGDNERTSLRAKLPLLALVVTSLLSILVSILTLRADIFIIFQNLYYFPIIIACYYYKKRGFLIAISLALVYFVLTMLYSGESAIIVNAAVRVAVFVLIAAVVTYMALARSQAEENLVLKAFNESIVQNISDGIVVLNDRGEIFFSNPAMQKMLGYEADELTGMQSETLVRPEDRVKLKNALERRKQGFTDHYELELTRKDRTNLPVHISGSPYRDSNSGKIIGSLTTVTDLTEFKNAERLLKEEYRLRNALLDNIPNYVALILKKDTREIVASNRAAREIGAVPGKTCYQTSALRDDPCPFCLAPKMWESGLLQQTEVEYRGAWYEGIWAPLSEDNYVHYIIDITERKRIEETLRLQASERAAVDTFTYSVSNDLKAPLRRIEGFSEALLEECSEVLNEQARDYLKRITNQIAAMKNLTDALLMLSRVVSSEIKPETVNLGSLARAHLEKLELDKTGHRAEVVVADDIFAEGDAELLKLMLTNLLDNAWKFTSRVKNARIEFGTLEQNGLTVYFLKDNGIGFDMAHADKLFAPFQKLHAEGEYPGIGIGLNIAYRILSRHGGEIWAEGEPGKGSCFFFTLPW